MRLKPATSGKNELENLEAAIGIEPMNKGFADHLGHPSLSITEQY